MFCTGFWSGVFISFIYNIFQVGIGYDQFLSGLLGAVCAYTLHILISMLEYIASHNYEVDV
jgi:hypothetical protein